MAKRGLNDISTVLEKRVSAVLPFSVVHVQFVSVACRFLISNGLCFRLVGANCRAPVLFTTQVLHLSANV